MIDKQIPKQEGQGQISLLMLERLMPVMMPAPASVSFPCSIRVSGRGLRTMYEVMHFLHIRDASPTYSGKTPDGN
jgi:hypothetical protein